MKRRDSSISGGNAVITHQQHVRFVMGCVWESKLTSAYGVIELNMVHAMEWLNPVILAIYANLFYSQLKSPVKIAPTSLQMHLTPSENKNAQ